MVQARLPSLDPKVVPPPPNDIPTRGEETKEVKDDNGREGGAGGAGMVLALRVAAGN